MQNYKILFLNSVIFVSSQKTLFKLIVGYILILFMSIALTVKFTKIGPKIVGFK